MIFSAKLSDKNLLTEIALKSKAFWDYSDELIASWKGDLTVSEKMISEMIVFKYVIDKKTIGFYILNQPNNFSIELEFLFVLPEFIGKGIGNQLLQHAFTKAILLDCKQITLLFCLKPFFAFS